MRTQDLFEQIIDLYTNPADITIFTGSFPYPGAPSPDFEVDVPLLVELLSDYYDTTFAIEGSSIHMYEDKDKKK